MIDLQLVTGISALGATATGWALHAWGIRHSPVWRRFGLCCGVPGLLVLAAVALNRAEPSPLQPSLHELSPTELSRTKPTPAEPNLPQSSLADMSLAELLASVPQEQIPLRYPEDPDEQRNYEKNYRLVYVLMGPPEYDDADPVLGYWRRPRKG